MFSPLLSFAVLGLYSVVGVTLALGGESETLTAWNTAIVALLIIGIALYIYGYLRREATDAEAKVILLFSFFLIPWAVFAHLFASGLYSDTIDWSMNPGVRALTIWDYMEYWTWELKAILWIGTGLLLVVTSLVKMHAARFCRKRLKKLQARA